MEEGRAVKTFVIKWTDNRVKQPFQRQIYRSLKGRLWPGAV